MRFITAQALLAVLTIATPAFGQQPVQKPTMPDSATFAQMTGMFNQMGPMYETMSQAMVEGTLKAFERPETIDRLARFARLYYEALIRQGFTKEEALQIAAGAGIPGAKVGH